MRLIFLVLLSIFNSSILTAEEQRTVTVIGTAETEVRPDTASLRLGVIARDKQLIEAKSTVDRRIQEVVQSIVKTGVMRDALRTSSIDYSTHFSDDDADYANPIYRVARDVSVTVPIEKIDLILQSATKAGANEIREIRYSSSNTEKISRETLSAAIENAKTTADFLATGFNAKLGKILKIQSDRASYPTNLALVVNAPQDPFGDENYTPEEITVTRTITVVFELVD